MHQFAQQVLLKHKTSVEGIFLSEKENLFRQKLRLESATTAACRNRLAAVAPPQKESTGNNEKTSQHGERFMQRCMLLTEKSYTARFNAYGSSRHWQLISLILNAEDAPSFTDSGSGFSCISQNLLGSSERKQLPADHVSISRTSFI